MNRAASLLVAVLVVASAFAAMPAGAALANPQADSHAKSTSQQASTATNNTSNDSIAPGARLAGVIGVQESDVQGEVESRAFGIKIAEAATADAKAGVVSEQLDESQRRVQALEQRLDRLRQARENGSISQGEFAARAATVHAKLNNVQHMTNKSADVARGLPEETLQAHGINVTAIQQLRQRAANLSGPEVAAIARTISGPSAGDRPGGAGDRPSGPAAGNQSTAGNRTTGTQPEAGNRTVSSGGGETRTGDTQRNETSVPTSSPRAGDRR